MRDLSFPKIPSGLDSRIGAESSQMKWMFAILYALGLAVADLVKSRARLEAEILLLRHQLNVALRHGPRRVRVRGGDRAFMVWMVQVWPNLLDVVHFR